MIKWASAVLVVTLAILSGCARFQLGDKKKASEDSFIVSAVVKKAAAKVNMGMGPQIILLVDTIAAE